MIVFPPLGIWVSVFLFSKLQSNPLVAILVVAVIMLPMLAIGVLSAFRIPVWHRARRRARDYIAQHGGEFPAELRWFS